MAYLTGTTITRCPESHCQPALGGHAPNDRFDSWAAPISLILRCCADLEIYFCRSLAFTLLLVALIMMFFTGSVPLSLSTSEPISLEDSDPKAPYAVPIVRVAAIYHAVALLYSYGSYVNSGRVGFVLGAIGSGAMAAMGIWCVMFGTETGRFSKRTGADKRTSGFPFKNDKAYNPKKDRKMK